MTLYLILKKVDYDVINYIVVYCYYVSAEKEKNN